MFSFISYNRKRTKTLKSLQILNIYPASKQEINTKKLKTHTFIKKPPTTKYPQTKH